ESNRPAGVEDHERPLAPRGILQSEAMGKYMAGQGLIPDSAIVSTARRAQDTWKLVLSAFAVEPSQKNESRIYEAAPGDILRVIQDVDANTHTLLVVGHNPGLETLAGYLMSRGRPQAVARLQKKFPTAGLAVLDFSAADWACVMA